MSAEKPVPTDRIYQLKVVLRDCHPMIWRRLRVTSDTSLGQLHTIIQIAMGWEDAHLHRFRIYAKEYGIYREGGMVFDDNPFQVTLAQFKLRKGERFEYAYDFGDFWEHDISFEQVLPRDPGTIYPVCIAGAGDCPPEDCGGSDGYQRLCAERYSWEVMEQIREDILLVAQRLLDFAEGGPRPTYEDGAFVDALERMRERDAHAPVPFTRRAVNAALGTWTKETTCTSASK